MDLVSRLAALQEADPGPDPEAWFTTTFGEPLTYSGLVGRLAHSEAERRALISRYIEPDPDEPTSRRPTAAHRAIAELAAKGYVRVILTTNFDRLLEQALEAAGVVPSVLATPDAMAGAVPLAHTRCVVVKVHGDYLDPRIKNTPAELDHYDPPVDALLGRVFEDCGLIVCGWSASWDTALVRAMERHNPRRYTNWWAAHHTSEEADRLVAHRHAQVIDIANADNFFSRLAEKVAALEDIDRPHPLSVATAVASLKRYLPEPSQVIRLHDLVVEEARRTRAVVAGFAFPMEGAYSAETLRPRIEAYEAAADVIAAMFGAGCAWSRGAEHDALWAKALGILGDWREGEEPGVTALLSLRRIPALVCLYSGGVASIASGRYDTLAALFAGETVLHRAQRQPLIMAVDPWAAIFDNEAERAMAPRHYTRFALSEHLLELVRKHTASVVTSQLRLDDSFDRFEYLLGLAHAHYDRGLGYNTGAAPVGRFLNRRLPDGRRVDYLAEMATEMDDHGPEWAPFAAAVFGASFPELVESRDRYHAYISQQYGRFTP